ncbi:hypothetical protein PCH_Pc14g02170 [Penicillium rubens Wisconsin 54-1255]|uniref:Uncharacterized protein n=1 Tax=Penicillium rubens (strain ATCC 28089 / DSM 1075 / NRRL 1951 / Wisconsin 54-1255) TaxID=500485 RepID=B6H644_PENRW|nr:hypothetical protein PCH_Pc14g02170 [Penicillium rubens Wisconsin 54-1255]
MTQLILSCATCVLTTWCLSGSQNRLWLDKKCSKLKHYSYASAQYQRIMTKKLKSPELLEAQNRPSPVGSLSWQRGAAEPSPSNNPQVVRNGTPFHTPYEQQ